jgi:hypothetical protein
VWTITFCSRQGCKLDLNQEILFYCTITFCSRQGCNIELPPLARACVAKTSNLWRQSTSNKKPEKLTMVRKHLGSGVLYSFRYLIWLTLNQNIMHLLYLIVLQNMIKYCKAFCSKIIIKHFKNDALLHCHWDVSSVLHQLCNLLLQRYEALSLL